MRIALLFAAFVLHAAAAGPVEKMMDVQQPALVEEEELVPVVEEHGGMETHTSCFSDWQPIGSRCFKFFKKSLPWIDAERYCLRYDANLASIHNMQENNKIQALIKSIDDTLPRSWIGGNDAVKNYQWFWSDGSKFDYDFFVVYPDNFDGKEHCIEMNAGDSHSWNDSPCDTNLPFVCGTRP